MIAKFVDASLLDVISTSSLSLAEKKLGGCISQNIHIILLKKLCVTYLRTAVKHGHAEVHKMK